MEILILTALGGWLFFALRACAHRKGSCGGSCSGCSGCSAGCKRG